MVANGTMGLLDCSVMALRSIGHGPWACETNAPLRLVIVFWEVCCGMKGLVWQKMAQWGLSAARRTFFEP